MDIENRPPLHLTAADMIDAPLSIPDVVGIVRETLDGFADGHLDLADRTVTVAAADPLFAGMLRLTIDGQHFDITVTEAL